ncbi:MAG: S-adenosyl-l-methionine hydroxide adenosyltransferase family protein [Kofleriaceae bacterium]
MAIITLTTDFGTRDGYVGAMKGVLERQVDRVRVIDIAHDIPPGDVAHAAWVVATAAKEFPDNTVHVVVVDPGVGTERQAVAVRSVSSWFVGPDNGVFDYIVETERFRAWALSQPRLAAAVGAMRSPFSATFHGRDLFAPAAAWLANDKDIKQLAEPAHLRGALPWGVRAKGQGRVVHIDRFGNLITDLPRGEAGSAIVIAGHTLPLATTYGDVEPGQLVAYIGSSETVEIAVRDGRADARLPCERGTLVVPTSDPAGPYR